MYQKTGIGQPKGQNKPIKKDTVETLRSFPSSVVKNTTNEFKKIGTGVFDQFFGNQDNSQEFNNFPEMNQWNQEQKTSKPQIKRESVFNYNQYYEQEIIKKEIKALSETVKKEIEYLKKAEKNLLNDVRDISNIAVESISEKPGIYHIRFLQLIISILRTLRAKIGESRTWLQAMVSKKKKRGSLFAVRTKKMGTQYSLSQELQTARSIQ